MSTSPVKFVRAAAAAVGGGGNPSQMGALQNIFHGNSQISLFSNISTSQNRSC